MAPITDYRKLVESSVGDPIAGFRESLRSADAWALAIVSIVDPQREPGTAVSLLDEFLGHDHAVDIDAQLVVGVLSFCEEGEVKNRTEAVLRERFRALPIKRTLAKHIEAAVLAEGPAQRRMWLLKWLYYHDAKAGVKVARVVVDDIARPYDEVGRLAIGILGRHGKEWGHLVAYAERHVRTEAGEGEADHDPQAALRTLNRAAAIRNIEDVIRIMSGLAGLGVSVGDTLDRMFGLLSEEELLTLITGLGKAGHEDWMASECLPGLLRVRPRDVAKSCGGDYWPAACLAMLAGTPWENYDPRLYRVAVVGLHTDGEEVGAQARAKAKAYCESLSAGTPERLQVGAVLLGLCLDAIVETDDDYVVGALGCLTEEEFASLVKRVGWKSSQDRARRLGKVVVKVRPILVAELSKQAREMIAEALLEGASGAELDGVASDVVRANSEREGILRAVVRVCDPGAEAVFEAWKSEHSLIAWRALAGSRLEEERLTDIPSEAQQLDRYSLDERRELLEAYGVRDERLMTLLAILGRWAKVGKGTTREGDLLQALELVEEHLRAGCGPEDTITTIGQIVRQSTNLALRTAGYKALGAAGVTDSLVDLLLERSEHELAKMQGVVSETLEQVAEKLDQLAATEVDAGARKAVGQLARVSPKRALPHARVLLGAEEPDDRLTATGILGDIGKADEDGPLFRKALEYEPDSTVRSAMQWALRRLEVGDSFEAHMRLGELVGIEDTDWWATLDPGAIYGQGAELIVAGLNRMQKAESREHYEEAIGSLDEIAKVLLFRAIDVAGDTIQISEKNRALAATNKLDYGTMVYGQQVVSNWKWATHFGSLHELRSAHLAKKGQTEPVPERTPEDLQFALASFRLGGGPCCRILAGG